MPFILDDSQKQKRNEIENYSLKVDFREPYGYTSKSRLLLQTFLSQSKNLSKKSHQFSTTSHPSQRSFEIASLSFSSQIHYFRVKSGLSATTKLSASVRYSQCNRAVSCKKKKITTTRTTLTLPEQSRPVQNHHSWFICQAAQRCSLFGVETRGHVICG